ncbi:hypothetical protein HPB47_021127 [Ixodes persulcatus]|uniref:Uncharacterized protein n=1 Tax=Ixodes persulcatus TaxID=34615 RepID=A0AC60QDG9_IXOPE|nr:hypothetical protein HPB47_021127 [Ixodes persulcatus]
MNTTPLKPFPCCAKLINRFQSSWRSLTRHWWTFSFPPSTASILASGPSDLVRPGLNLEDLAKLADSVMEVAVPNIAHVQNQSGIPFPTTPSAEAVTPPCDVNDLPLLALIEASARIEKWALLPIVVPTRKIYLVCQERFLFYSSLNSMILRCELCVNFPCKLLGYRIEW